MALHAAEISILPLVLKGHGFSRADKVNQISVGFSHRGTYFRIFGEIQPFPATCLGPDSNNPKQIQLKYECRDRMIS